MRPLRYGAFGILIAPLFVLARQHRSFEMIAFAFLFGMIIFLVFESFHPQLRLRKKPLPKPEVRLNIDGPPN